MANIKISELDPAASVADADLSEIVQSGTNKKSTFGLVKTWIKSWIVKADVGLSNVDNTSDASKPVSTAQQTALNDKQDLDATLTAIAALTTAANKLIYATGSDTFTTADLTAFARSILDDADAATARTTLGLGTMAVESASTYAPLASPTFTGTPAVPTASGGTNTTQAASTAFVRGEISSLVDSAPGTLDTLNELAAALGDDPDFATTVATAIGGKQAADATLTALAAVTTSSNKLIYATASDTFTTTDLSSYGRSLIDDADASAARTTLGLGTMATETAANYAALAANNTFTGKVKFQTDAVIDSLDFTTYQLLMQNDDDGGNQSGVVYGAYANSASPAVADVIFRIAAWGNNSVGSANRYFRTAVTLLNVTAGAETSHIGIETWFNGAYDNRIEISGGVFHNTATGGDKGIGTFNFVTLYENGTSLAAKYASLGAANDFTEAQTITKDTAYPLSIARPIDAAGATFFKLERSKTTAATGNIGGIDFFGTVGSGGGQQLYSRMVGVMDSVTSGAWSGSFAIGTTQLGTFNNRLIIGAGVYTLGATSGDMGSGTINATAFYKNGVNIFAAPTITGNAIIQGAAPDTGAPAAGGADNKGTLNLYQGDAGASGPILNLFHDSASPATNDALCRIQIYGKNSSSTVLRYAAIGASLFDPTAGAEFSGINFNTYYNGASGTRAWLGAGFYMAGATGGDKGANSINTTTLYKNGSLSGAAFSAHKNGTDQTGIASITLTKVTFGTEQFDDGAFFDTTNSKWTPPAGKVSITACVRAINTLTAASEFTAFIYKNGSVFKNLCAGLASSVGATISAGSIVDEANGTDYYEVYVYGTSAGTYDLKGGASQTYFMGHTL